MPLAKFPVPRIMALNACWVRTMNSRNTVAQKAARPGEKRSTVRHQINTTRGTR